MRMKLWKIARYILVVVSGASAAVILFGLYKTLRPIDALGEASENCVRQDFSPVSSGSGLVATAHFTSCDYFIVHGDQTTYIYVNRVGTKEDRKSLVFRFSNFNHLDPPEITWSDKSSLHISVPAVGEVTEQVAAIDGVKIFYSIGKEDLPAGESKKENAHIAEVLFPVLVALIVICMLTARSIQKLNKKSI